MSIKDFKVDFDAQAGLLLGQVKADETTDDNAQAKAYGACGFGTGCAGGGGQCGFGVRCAGG
ncbi:MAG: hypothetical protein IKE46_10550 [Selenomonadaceae bacterium]|nr:hypothetical protein [Selenomonadaceae bacterium]